MGDDGSSLCLTVLADAPYLVALALINQAGVRAMPLGGRSLPVDAGEPVDEAPHAMAHEVVLELLVRVWQRSDDGDLRRAAGVGSLLLVELSMERLNDALPVLKAAWLETGDTAAFHQGLQTTAFFGGVENRSFGGFAAPSVDGPWHNIKVTANDPMRCPVA